MWAQKDEKDFWLHWLQSYREFKCLWDYETKRKASRSERMAAYQELAELAKVVNPAADVNFVKSRINAFRTCYRREFKKMEAARQNGIDYKPQLFYFETLKFVNPEEHLEDSMYDNDAKSSMKIDCSSNNSADDEDPICWTQRKEETAKRLSLKKEAIKKTLPEPSRVSFTKTSEKRKKEPSIDIDFEHIDEDFEPTDNANQIQFVHQKQPVEDEYALFGKRIAAHFRNMESNQRLIAEKIISDVCIYARMERLTLQSSVLVETPNNQSIIEQEEDENIDYDDPDTYIYTS